jgi:abortive infection bacteriophage resistance protein
MKAPFNKPPLTFEQQLDRLVERGLACADRPLALCHLTHINYYRLAAYFLPFEADHATHTFRSGTRFDDVLGLYVFDRELRLLTLDAIERIEVSIRTGWAYVLAHHHDAHAHLKETLFKKSTRWNYAQLIQKLHDETQKSRETFVKHFRERYAETLPPVWAIAEVMTLGELSKWYDCLRSSADRNAVARRYDMDETNLASFLHHLSTVRNLCAHHARLWNREFTVTFSLPRRRPKVLAESLNRENKRIYNTLSVMAYLMDCVSPHHHWKFRVKELLMKYLVDIRAMGFPQKWETLPVWRDKGEI